MFLRELPNPLLTRELYRAFLATESPTLSDTSQITALRLLMCMLPPAHASSLWYVLVFLARLSSRAVTGHNADELEATATATPSVALVGDDEVEADFLAAAGDGNDANADSVGEGKQRVRAQVSVGSGTTEDGSLSHSLPETTTRRMLSACSDESGASSQLSSSLNAPGHSGLAQAAGPGAGGNLMTAENLSICLAPNLLSSAAAVISADEQKSVNAVVTRLIECNSVLFMVPTPFMRVVHERMRAQEAMSLLDVNSLGAHNAKNSGTRGERGVAGRE